MEDKMFRGLKILLIIAILFSVSLGFAGKIMANKSDAITINPNPFKSVTTIKVELPNAEVGSLKILDMDDNLLITLFEGKFNEGFNRFTWDGTGIDGQRLPNGNYFIEYTGNARYTSIKKIIILK